MSKAVKKRNVFIVKPRMDECTDYVDMFAAQGWEETDSIILADLIQFVGGHDVSPYLYGQIRHKTTHFNLARDKREIAVFALGVQYQLPMAGICRGGQFLNVMCGGSMWQNVDGHAEGRKHDVKDTVNDETFSATSTHHQMMIEGPKAELLGIANECTRKEKMGISGMISAYRSKSGDGWDNEIIYYSNPNALCFQPHPEFAGVGDLRDRYFYYIERYLFGPIPFAKPTDLGE